MTLPELFDLSLVPRRDDIGLEWNGRAYSFGEIDDRASRMARALAARGLGHGDRLAVYLPNRLEYIDLFLAVTRLGAIFVPVNILYRDREIAHILSDADPRALVADEASLAHVPSGAPVWNVEALAAETNRQPAQRATQVHDGDTPAAIVYTSGTTGVAKGAVLTHHNFAVNATNLTACWQITAHDRLLLTLPLFHVHGLGNGLHCWLTSGCRLQLRERFEHQHAAAWLKQFAPTLFFGVPTMYIRLLEIDEAAAREIGAQARLFVSGSAPLAAQTHQEFHERFGHTILERYGMSETLMNISNPYAGERRAGTVGRPLPGVRVRNLNPAGEPVPDGETGELHIQGPNLFSGYWRRPEATAEAMRDGWFRTSDIAVRSPDGYYTLQGRRSDLIIAGGFNIYPREIEEFLLERPGIREAAVVARPDPVRGEQPVAYLAGDFDAAAIEQACRRHLASFKIPRAFVKIDKLPRTALGKVQKHLLGSE